MAENRRRLNWGTLAAVAAAGALLAGAVLVMTALQDRVDQARDYSNTFGGATVVVVEVDAAEVQIGVSTTGQSTVQTRLLWNTPRQPLYLAELVGDTLTVRSRGCGFHIFGAYCEARVTITVPAEVDLRVSTDSGGVRVTGMRGSVRLSADSGDLDVSGLSGPLSAQLDSGQFLGRNLTSSTVEVEVDSGDVNLQFDIAPSAVRARTDSGQVVIGVPPGSGPYGVRTHTDSGEATVAVTTGVSAQHQIDAATDSGDITIRYQAA
jgi:DUF4097 and DUF4098 domain-containing protein YvlB